MHIRRLRALILHRTPAREKDRMIEVFTREEGKRRVLAAGIRRFPSRRAGHLEPLFETELMISTSSRGESVRGARVIHAFPHLRERLSSLETAYRIAGLLRTGTAEHLADPALYDVVLSQFHALNHPSSPAHPELLVQAAHVHVLRHLGLLPSLDACVRCRRSLQPHAFVFAAAEGGFLCGRCDQSRTSDPLLTDAVKLLRLYCVSPVFPPQVVIPDSVREHAAGILGQMFRSPAVREHVR